MCLAVPARVVNVDTDAETADVMLGGIRKSISTALLDEVAEGDYVLVHVGYALHRLDAGEAEATLDLMREAGISAAAVSGSTRP